MLLELRDHDTAPFTAALQPQGRSCKKHRARPGAHAFGSKDTFASRPTSCAVAAMTALVHWIKGIDVVEQINERFPPVNNIGLSFAILSSVEIVHELIDWKFLREESTIRGRILWKSKLFCDLAVGFYWVQLNLRDSV